MNMLANLATDSSIAPEVDSLGSGYKVLESGIYKGTVVLAHVGTADSGAMSLNITLKLEDETEVNQTFWMTSGTAKGGKNYYEKDGKKNYLPGFISANSLAQLTLGKEISQADLEDKVVNMWNNESKAKVPTKVKMLVDLLNKDIAFGIIKQTVDKNAKDDTGKYVATGETREENEIDKFFRAEDMMTMAEILAKSEEAAFAGIWAAKWAGVVKNKAKGAAAGGSVAGAPKAAAAAKPKTSLFS